MQNSRSDGYWYEPGRCILPGDQFGVNVAVQFVVDVVVADVLEGGSAGRAFEALDVKILLLYSHEDAAVDRENSKDSGLIVGIAAWVALLIDESNQYGESRPSLFYHV